MEKCSLIDLLDIELKGRKGRKETEFDNLLNDLNTVYMKELRPLLTLKRNLDKGKTS